MTTDIDALIDEDGIWLRKHTDDEQWLRVDRLLHALTAEHARAKRLRLELEEEHIAYLKLMDRLNAK